MAKLGDATVGTLAETLVKAPIETKINPVHQAEMALAVAAAEKLGYRAMYNNLGGLIPGKLGHVLAELGIEPFTRESVDKYKRETVNKLRRKHTSQYVTASVSWARVHISQYPNRIEPHALSTALEIQSKLPGVTFDVEEVRVNTVKRPMDPFLIAKFGNEEYYVAVWNEPEFEKSLF